MDKFIPPTLAETAAQELAAFAADQLGEQPLPVLAIDARDQMLRFFIDHHHGHRELARVDYFRSGLSVQRAVRQILEWRFGSRAGDVRLLDFAGGFGRVTRWLTQLLPPQQVWMAEIFPEAVEFQRQVLGVDGFASAHDPAELRAPGEFDCVLASSLFSHLPQTSFVAWLRRLYGLLRPGGVVLFSVIDAGLEPSGSAAAFTYRDQSEIPELPADRYGVTWVSEAFVRSAVAEATQGTADCLRVPRALWSFQDLYVVCRGAAAGPISFAHEPVGYLEVAERSADARQLVVSGWAFDHHGPGIAEVRIRLDGEVIATCPADLLRNDVASFFAAAAPFCCGFHQVLPAPAGESLPGDALLGVTAVSASGATFLIHLAKIEATELYLRLRRQTQALAEANGRASAAEARAAASAATESLQRERLRQVEMSRFWKARNLWWRLRARLGQG
jgi:2-polyprenyl-3-methyl-5-hydroxy-6-metoxy-1,4-benzoquinol methylase